MQAATTVVKTHAEGLVWVITLARPQARNAINTALAHQFSAAIDEFERRPELRVAILTGEGGHFSAGMDLKAFADGERPFLPNGGFAGFVERVVSKPVIAAVEGYALAGGFELALACDLLVASRSARFGLPEARRGLVAAAGGLLRLPTLVPRNLAMELALTGRMLDADEAARAGLLNRLVEPGEALQAALTLAQEIAVNAPLSLAASKQIVQASRAWPHDEMFALQQPLAGPVLDSADATEGARAFAEKRAPQWAGR